MIKKRGRWYLVIESGKTMGRRRSRKLAITLLMGTFFKPAHKIKPDYSGSIGIISGLTIINSL